MEEFTNKTWLKLSYPEEFLNVLFREWACFFSKRLHPEAGTKFIDLAQNANANDIRSSYIRSKCMQEVAKTKEALKDAAQAYSLNPDNATLCLQLADTIYDTNRFEDALTSLSNDSKKFHINKARVLVEEMDIIFENFKDNLGDNLFPFAVKYSKLIEKLAKDRLAKNKYNSKPSWKLRLEAKECDAQSILSEQTELLHPRIIEKRKLYKKVLRQVYLQKSWTDMQFLLELSKNKALLLPQTQRSTQSIKNILKTHVTAANDYLRMLHARAPLYSIRGCNFDKKSFREVFKQNYLQHLQKKVRRDVFLILDEVRNLRVKGKVSELESYILEKMNKCTILRTKRLLSWKFEFINEIYNTLALTYIESFVLPKNIDSYDKTKQIFILLKIPKRDDRNVKFVFGDKSTYHEPDAVDYNYIRYRKRILRLENWLKFSVYPIEKCFIYHDIARMQFGRGKYKECLVLTKKLVEEADACGNTAWKFLAKLITIRVKTSQKIWKDVDILLQELLTVIKNFTNPQLTLFVKKCITSTQQVLLLENRSH